MRIPLNIRPEDRSPEAENKRYNLLCFMMSLNPSGFRVPAGGKPDHRKKSRRPNAAPVGRYARLAMAGISE